MSLGPNIEQNRNEYRVPASVTNSIAALLLALFILSVWLLWFYRPDQLVEKHKILFLSIIYVPGFLIVWAMKRVCVRIDSQGVICADLFSSKKMTWGDVEDLVNSERLILLRDARGQELKLFHSEFGSIEPFEDLREEIIKNVIPRLRLLWNSGGDRFLVSYPPLAPLSWFGYSIPFLVIGALLALLTFRFGASFLFIFCGFAVTALVIGPLFIRDFLNTKKHLFVSPAGLLCKGPGSKIEMTWEEIGEIVIEEPLTVGYGKIIINSKTGNQSIAIPRSVKKCGYILYLLQTKTGLRPSQSFDY